MNIPLIYHPTSVLYLDDDLTLLNTLCLHSDVRVPYFSESEPLKAMDYLSSNYYKNDYLSHLVEVEDDINSDKESVLSSKLDLSKLVTQLNTFARFKKVSVVVIDKTMPTMDGLDFCKKVREMEANVKLVLLTGTLGAKHAVDAFHKGEIDAYFPKDELVTLDDLNAHIRRLFSETFIDLSQSIIRFIPEVDTLYSDPGFSQMFESFKKEKGIIEHYIIDVHGSQLLINEDGKGYVCVIRRDSDFDEAFEFARNSGAKDSVLSKLQKRTAFPIDGIKKLYLVLDDDWEQHLLEMSPCTKGCYFGLYPVNDYGIASFKKYFNDVWSGT